MSKFRVKYSDAFKEKAIRMITEERRPLTAAAAVLGVPNSVLSKWVKKHRDASRPDAQHDAKGKREPDLRQLAKRIERLEGSLEVLRKIVQGELLLKVKSEFPG